MQHTSKAALHLSKPQETDFVSISVISHDESICIFNVRPEATADCHVDGRRDPTLHPLSIVGADAGLIVCEVAGIIFLQARDEVDHVSWWPTNFRPEFESQLFRSCISFLLFRLLRNFCTYLTILRLCHACPTLFVGTDVHHVTVTKPPTLMPFESISTKNINFSRQHCVRIEYCLLLAKMDPDYPRYVVGREPSCSQSPELRGDLDARRKC